MKVMLFARLRELAGDNTPEIADELLPAPVAEVRAHLKVLATPDLRDALEDPNTICAVNQHVVDDGHLVNAEDELAFFPPMTGG